MTTKIETSEQFPKCNSCFMKNFKCNCGISTNNLFYLYNNKHHYKFIDKSNFDDFFCEKCIIEKLTEQDSKIDLSRDINLSEDNENIKVSYYVKTPSPENGIGNIEIHNHKDTNYYDNCMKCNWDFLHSEHDFKSIIKYENKTVKSQGELYNELDKIPQLKLIKWNIYIYMPESKKSSIFKIGIEMKDIIYKKRKFTLKDIINVAIDKYEKCFHLHISEFEKEILNKIDKYYNIKDSKIIYSLNKIGSLDKGYYYINEVIPSDLLYEDKIMQKCKCCDIVIEKISNACKKCENCLSQITHTIYHSCTCHLCEDWGGCGAGGWESFEIDYYTCYHCYPKTIFMCKCSKCNEIFNAENYNDYKSENRECQICNSKRLEVEKKLREENNHKILISKYGDQVKEVELEMKNLKNTGHLTLEDILKYQNMIINFGKLKEKTYKEMWEKDKKYCIWARDKIEFISREFKQYINYKDNK